MEQARRVREMQECSNPADHSPGPDGYDEWYAWLDRMEETHEWERCTVCGHLALFTPRGEAG